MFKNYLTIALRNLRKHRSYTLINVAGLGVGMACCLLIVLFVRYEYSVNQQFSKADQIYRINSLWHQQDDQSRLISAAPLAPRLRTDFNEVADAVRYTAVDITLLADNHPFRASLLIAESNVFALFDFVFVQGDPQTALAEPNTIVLTEEQARTFFGTSNALGQLVQIDTWGGEGRKAFRVTGVIQEPTYNSLLYIGQDFHGLIVPFANAGDFFAGPDFDQDWSVWNTVTYLELAPGQAPDVLENKVQALLDVHIPDEMRGTVSLELQRLADVYLDEAGGSARKLVRMLLVLAMLILGIASINFVNLSTARAATRAREVGIRKVFGAAKIQLVRQFIGESMLLCAVAMLLAIGMAEFSIGAFGALVERPLVLNFADADLWLLIAGTTLGAGLLSGIYPALYLVTASPVKALKELINTGRAALAFRRVLVVIQFVVAIGLFVAATVIAQQADYLLHRDPGFEKDNVLVISSLPREWTPAGVAKLQVVQDRLRAVPGVRTLSLGWGPPGPRYTGLSGDFRLEGWDTDRTLSVPISQVDASYLETFGLRLVAGRFFAEDRSDPTPTVVLNEQAAQAFGGKRAVGQRVLDGDTVYEIIGVVRDYDTLGRVRPGPLVLMDVRQSPFYRDLSIRLVPGSQAQTLEAVQAAWASVYPDVAFEYYFLDDQWTGLYNEEQRAQQIASLATALAILIACLGLLGLVSISIRMRTREIGIRKVLGASVPGIFVLLSKEFLRLVLAAFLVATPVTYLIMQRWLEGFGYHIGISGWVFLVAGLTALGVALLAIGFHAIRAATADPVESLRYE